MITMWEDYRNVTSLTSLQPLILRAFLIMCLFLVYHVEVVTTPRWWVSPLPGDDSAFLGRNLLIIFPGDKQSKTEIRKITMSGQSCQFDLSKWSFISIMDQIFWRNFTWNLEFSRRRSFNSKWVQHREDFSHFFYLWHFCPVLYWPPVQGVLHAVVVWYLSVGPHHHTRPSLPLAVYPPSSTNIVGLEVWETFENLPSITDTGDPTAVRIAQRLHGVVLSAPSLRLK